MSDPCRKLQNNVGEILKDLRSMSADVIKKSSIELGQVENLDELSVTNVVSSIKTLLSRVNTNVEAFVHHFDTAITEYQSACKINSLTNIPESKPSVATNGDTEETDIDLTQSDEELEYALAEKSHKPPKSADQKIGDDCSPKGVVVDDDVSDTDSEKTVQNFDVPITEISAPGASDSDYNGDELGKTLDQLDQLSNDKTPTKPIEKEQVKSFESESFDFDEVTITKEPISSSEMGSFDFDDMDGELNAAMDKFENSIEAPSDVVDQTLKDNRELLDLLTKAVGDEKIQEDGRAANEVVLEALKQLENDNSLPSDPEWDDDDEDKSIGSLECFSDDEYESDDGQMTTPKDENSEPEGDTSDTENVVGDAQLEYKLKTCDINLTKLDEMDDAEIDRLCNLQNINKRKCVKDLKNLRRRRLKRRRLTFSSSSSSSTSLSSCGSATPDLVFDRQPSPIIDLPDVTALADDLVERLVNTSNDSDSETSSDLESEPSQRPKPTEEKQKEQTDMNEQDEDVEIKSETGEEEKKKKKRGTWRDELIFDTSSSDSDTDEPTIVPLNDPLKEKAEEDDDDKDKVKLKVVNDGVMIITDSDESSSSDDVEFVDEVLNDDSSGPRGRRNIRTILSDSQLSEMTQRAKHEEDLRISRVQEHSKTVELIQSQHDEFVLDADVKTGKALVTVASEFVNILKPHQKEGVKFMWEACYESVEMLKTTPGTGCILAHCMGLGKTLQVITLIHTLFTHPVTNTKHVLIACPLSTVTNWGNEFKNAFDKLRSPCNNCRFFKAKGDIKDKINTVLRWRSLGGVLAMGYETFTALTNDKLASRVGADSQKRTFEALLNPGPDLIVCDEGHQLKNEKTLRTKALLKVKSKRRIVLTGTPLQNNLTEYFHMVDFVKTRLLGTLKEFTNRFATPIENGQYYNSTPEDIQLMKRRTHILTQRLKKTVDRVEVGVLSSYLPEIIDYTIFIKLTPLQMELYTKYIKMVTGPDTELGRGFFADIMMLSFNNLHPYTIQLYDNKPKSKKKTKKKGNDETLDDEKKMKKKANDETRDDEQDLDVDHVKTDWFKSCLPEDVATNVNYSAKLDVILKIVDESALVGDKVLIFAQKLVELDLLEIFLKHSRNWHLDVDYCRMDGRTNVELRDDLCKRFNTNPKCKVFLLTHRVGGLGLNLTGANRVIMIGSNHNPSLDTQSMFRVYRFGQTKKCYVYRLLSLATMEEKIYRRCVVKLHLSGTVVDKLHYTRKFMSTDLQEMYKVDFDEYLVDRPTPTVPNDKLLATLLQNITDVYKYYPHNSLLENRPEDELTEEDKKLAWDEFNHMEEAAKQPYLPTPPPPPPRVAPLVPVSANAMLSRLPIYPANPMFPYNKFGQFCSTRVGSTNYVPNPMNSNSRGFIPRGLLTNGMRPSIPSHSNRMPRPNIPSTSQDVHQKNFFQYNNNFNSVSRNLMAPPTNHFNPRAVNNTPAHQSSTINRTINVDPYGPRIGTSSNVPNWPRTDNARSAEILQSLREDIVRLMREHPDAAANDEATSSGEFNYALNKVV